MSFLKRITDRSTFDVTKDKAPGLYAFSSSPGSMAEQFVLVGDDPSHYLYVSEEIARAVAEAIQDLEMVVDRLKKQPEEPKAGIVGGHSYMAEEAIRLKNAGFNYEQVVTLLGVGRG